ncbi:MAG: hypothetical protein GC182_19210 [Rhodopseudomonas sp.]|nr:hypothetical protein [Rhodopseudomonas sp.]
MAYVTEIAVSELDTDDWHKGLPKKDPNKWKVVCNKDNDPQDFNKGHGGKFIYIYFKQDESGYPISGLRMITGKDANPPAPWQKIDVDLNAKAGGEFIYLCYQNTANAPQISILKAGFGDTVESAMNDFSAGDIVLRQDANQGSGGKFIFLGFAY